MLFGSVVASVSVSVAGIGIASYIVLLVRLILLFEIAFVICVCYGHCRLFVLASLLLLFVGC